jgi:hypothetical protein
MRLGFMGTMVEWIVEDLLGVDAVFRMRADGDSIDLKPKATTQVGHGPEKVGCLRADPTIYPAIVARIDYYFV